MCSSDLHLREVFTIVCRENQELQAALAARPTLPDPPSDHSGQVTTKQTQAVSLQATLHSTAAAASALLRSLQECSLALTVKTQPIAAQLQQIARDIQATMDPARLDQLYTQSDELELHMQQTEAESAAAKHVIRDIHPPLRTHADAMHQLDAKAEAQLATLFGAAPTPIDEAAANRISQEAFLLMQEWQQAVAAFTELRDSALRQVPELGPLFGQPSDGA